MAEGTSQVYTYDVTEAGGFSPTLLFIFILTSVLTRNYFIYTLFSEVIVTFPTSASMFSTTQQKPVFPGRLRSLSKAPCGFFCKDAYSTRPSASSILSALLSELPNEIKLCLVKACVLRSLFVLLFISICYTHCTFFPFEETDCFLSRPAACSCIQVAWLQQHFTGFSLKAKCVCSF